MVNLPSPKHLNFEQVINELSVYGELLHSNDRTRVDLKKIETDSRKVEEGDIFIAYSGVGTDGHQYIDSLQNKPGLLLVEKDFEKFKSLPYPVMHVKSSRKCWALLCSLSFDHPQKSLNIILSMCLYQ